MQTHTPISILGLPSDLLLEISPYLPYPDLLALRHTHPYFYHSPLLPGGSTPRAIRLRISWLVDRADRRLPLPQGSCNVKTDAEFCANPEVRLIMRRRRKHADCREGRECEVTGGRCLSSCLRSWWFGRVEVLVLGVAVALAWLGWGMGSLGLNLL